MMNKLSVVIVIAALVALPVAKAFGATCWELGNCSFNTSAPLETFTQPYKDVLGEVFFSVIVTGVMLAIVWWRSGSHIVATMIGLVFLAALSDSLQSGWELVVYYGVSLAIIGVSASFVFIFKRGSGQL